MTSVDVAHDLAPVRDVAAIAAFGQRVQENVATVIVGKDEVVRLLLVALLCEGHILLEPWPEPLEVARRRAEPEAPPPIAGQMGRYIGKFLMGIRRGA